MVHKEFACRYSPVIEAAVNNESIDAYNPALRYYLDDAEPETFTLLAEFLYCKNITLKEHGNAYADMEYTGDHKQRCIEQDLLLIKVWILANKLQIGILQNLVIDHLVRIGKICGPMSILCLIYIYENTFAQSPLRRLVAKQYAWQTPEDNWDSLALFTPATFFVDVVKAFAEAAPENLKTKKFLSITADEYYVAEDPE